MTYKLYLDDLRQPPDENWVVARSFIEAKDLILQKGWPNLISFDHDLGLEATGYDFAKWLVDYDLDNKNMPNNFQFEVHSANPVGAKNIQEYLNGYLEQKKKN